MTIVRAAPAGDDDTQQRTRDMGLGFPGDPSEGFTLVLLNKRVPHRILPQSCSDFATQLAGRLGIDKSAERIDQQPLLWIEHAAIFPCRSRWRTESRRT
jgi:hypothetical protein